MQVRQIRVAADLHEKSKGLTKEGAKELVTDGDMKSHLTMYTSLQKAFPGLQVKHEVKEVCEFWLILL